MNPAGRPTGEIRDKVLELRRRNPRMSATEIAAELGVTRERARQVLNLLGLVSDTRRIPKVRPVRKIAVKSRLRTGGVEVPINAAAAGTIAELLAAADLTARGYTVYAPICRWTAHADLIALRRGDESNPITIEVRSGRRSTGASGLSYVKKPKSKATHYAIVLTGEPVVYEPPL